MLHSCQFLCSELVTVTYEQDPGQVRQVTGNLEEISTHSAVVLLEEQPSLGASISFAVKGRDLFGIIKGRLHDAALGWYTLIGLDTASLWNRDWFCPQHLLAICECSWKEAIRARAWALENSRNTEENVPVDFLLTQA